MTGRSRCHHTSTERWEPVRALRAGVLLLVALALPASVTLASPEGAVLEATTVKAVFMERFTRFVHWPQDTLPTWGEQPFVLGTVGKSPLVDRVHEIYSRRPIRNKRVQLRRIVSLDEIPGCHMLLVAGSEEPRLAEILAQAEGHAMLVVGDSKGFAKRGVLINFYVDQDHVRFEINEAAVRRSRLSVRHLLMRVAKLVPDDGEGER